jgi:acyl CoA:acetate/3-ketoacid CoA transferase alpha subunit
MPQLMSLADAVAATICDGDVVAMEGFTHLISTAAGHEGIRQRRRDLNLIRMTRAANFTIMSQGKRSFVEKLDFVTSLGHGEGGDARIRPCAICRREPRKPMAIRHRGKNG